MEGRVFYRMLSGIAGLVMLIGTLNMFSNFLQEYEDNILVETQQGIIIESNKEILKNFFSEKIKYETAIKIGDEVIISNDKEVYYEAMDKKGQEVEVEIRNNKNIDIKTILDIK